jgi:glucan phosphoethanolaminetransferase (alkaline phosphatase superfamily)
MRNKILFYIIFYICFTFLLLADDFIFQFFNNTNKAELSFAYTFLAFIVAVLISLMQNKKAIYIVLGIFAFLDITQLGYLAYFGSYLQPVIIPLVFTEIPEIALAGFGEFYKSYYAFIAVGLPYSILYWGFKKYNFKLYKVKYIWLLLLFLLCYFPKRAIESESIGKLTGNYERPSLYNGLKVYNGYFFNILLKKQEPLKFEPYTITKKTPQDVNIIIVYGESFNYHNQHLFGYQLKTTPLLDKLAKTDKNFKYKKGIASAVTTSTSLSSFFNMQKEPQNYSIQIKQDFNIFRLAKEQEYKTYLISAQTKGILANVGIQYTDVAITKFDEKKIFETIGDEGLIDILKRYDIENGKNLIVLHQRSMHAPYWTNYSHKEKEFAKFTKNDYKFNEKQSEYINYDNNMLYNDYILNGMIEYFKKSKKPFYLFITSDHGELSGQLEGKSGHGILEKEVSEVPMFFYTNVNDSDVERDFVKKRNVTHYEIGEMVLKIMGYTLKNPNTPNNVFYVNGTDLMGRYGYMKVIKSKKDVEYEIVK